MRDKVISNIAEVRARGARNIVLAEAGDEQARAEASTFIEVPKVSTLLHATCQQVSDRMKGSRCDEVLAQGVGGVVGKDMDEQQRDQRDLPSSVVPYLAVVGGVDALHFYATAMGAVETNRMANDDGTLGHAEFMIGRARFYLADEWPEMGVRSPVSLGGNSVSLSIEVDDAQAWVERATNAGARIERPVEPGPEEGSQSGWIVDPFGHRWHLMSRL